MLGNHGKLHPEGLNTQQEPSEKYRYCYNIPDHLGNIRLVIGDDANATPLQTNDYTPFGVAISSDISKNNYLYNGKELQDATNWLDYGARMYYPELGRWMAVDALAEADEDFSPYLYTSNNPVLNIDLFGLTDVNGDGKDDGTILPQVTVIAQRDESTLNNIQLTLDGIGLYPGAGTVAGVVNAGIDIYRGNYGSAGLNLLSAVPVLGTAMKGTKLAVMGTKAISSMAKMKVMKAAIPLVIRRLKPAGTQLHHIIPKGVYKDNAAIFDQLKNFDIDNIGNLIPLNKGFHGNHPAYSEYVAKELTELATQNGGKLTIQHITQTVDKMEGVIQKANNSSSNLNDYIRTLK